MPSKRALHLPPDLARRSSKQDWTGRPVGTGEKGKTGKRERETTTWKRRFNR